MRQVLRLPKGELLPGEIEGHGRPFQKIKLTGFPGGHRGGTPRWSPDGTRIVFDDHSSNWDLWLIDPDGESLKHLTKDHSDEVLGMWSPDSGWIYFTSNRTGRQEIYKMPAAGGQAVPVTTDGGSFGWVSKDGRHLYYTKGFSAGPLWRLPANGDGKEEVVLPDLIPEVRPWRWALGKHGIYFSFSRTALDFRVLLVDWHTRTSKEIYREHGPYDRGGLAISPDEDWLLLEKRPWWESELMLVENFR